MYCYCKCLLALHPVPWVGLQCVIVVIPGHSHLLFVQQCTWRVFYLIVPKNGISSVSIPFAKIKESSEFIFILISFSP